MSELSTLTAALERCWTAIRTIHPHARPAVICVYLHSQGNRRGHYLEDGWTLRDKGKADEVHVSSHILSEGAESVFRTLLHEACHSVAVARGIQDTSRQGRYHNYDFAKLASELGLLTQPSKEIGYVTLNLAPGAIVTFENALSELEDSLEMWQGLRQVAPNVGSLKTRNNSIKAVCPDCGRIVRMSAKSYNFGPILCVPCGTVFEAVNIQGIP